jgi:hypothetical protein
MYPKHIKLLILGDTILTSEESISDALFQYLSYIDIGEPEEINYITIMNRDDVVGLSIYQICRDLKIPVKVVDTFQVTDSMSKYYHDLDIANDATHILVLSKNFISKDIKYQINLMASNDIEYTQIIINN